MIPEWKIDSTPKEAISQRKDKKHMLRFLGKWERRLNTQEGFWQWESVTKERVRNIFAKLKHWDKIDKISSRTFLVGIIGDSCGFTLFSSEKPLF